MLGFEEKLYLSKVYNISNKVKKNTFPKFSQRVFDGAFYLAT